MAVAVGGAHCDLNEVLRTGFIKKGSKDLKVLKE